MTCVSCLLQSLALPPSPAPPWSHWLPQAPAGLLLRQLLWPSHRATPEPGDHKELQSRVISVGSGAGNSERASAGAVLAQDLRLLNGSTCRLARVLPFRAGASLQADCLHQAVLPHSVACGAAGPSAEQARGGWMTSYGSEVTEVGPADCRESEDSPHPKRGLQRGRGLHPHRGQWQSHAARRGGGGSLFRRVFGNCLLHSLRHDIFLSVLCGEIF